MADMEESDIIVSSAEIIKDKLYFATLEGSYRPKSTKNSKFFHIEDEIVYESFYEDFGPYHLSHLYQFCCKLHAKLARAPKTKRVVFYTSDNCFLRLNAAYLIAGYAIIYLKKQASWAHAVVTGPRMALTSFRDASGGPARFEVSLLDVLQGLQRASELGLFDFARFNHHEYQYYEKVTNGDLNWILPGKMLAFSGPHAQSQIKDGYPLHAPDHYHRYFRDNSVTTIVRLNRKTYSSKQFTDYGFDHFELFFIDGSAPSDNIVFKFIKICEEAKGAVAVHCKAGLGRTGTLIGCYMMKHLEFTARQAIGWLRICRPGSVIGHQQRFMENMQARMFHEGTLLRRAVNRAIPKFKFGIYSNLDTDDDDVENANLPEPGADNAPKAAVCRIIKLDGEPQTVATKQKSDNFVTLDSIINTSASPSAMETRSVNLPKTRASTALSTAKPTNATNKHNFLSSVCPSATPKPASPVKLQTTFPTKKATSPISSLLSPNLKSSSFPVKTVASVSLPLKYNSKNQYPKSSGLHSQRANLARNHGQNFTFNHSAGPVKTYMRKTISTAAKLTSSNHDNIIVDSSANSASSITTMTESCSLNSKAYDANLNVTYTSKSNVDGVPRKKLLRKKANLTDFRIDNNSDSERDSTNTILTNISADSLENIPCKMATRKTKSRSPEPMEQCGDAVGNCAREPEEGVDSQGSKLYKIKATRKKIAGFGASPKKEGVQTRSYSCSPSAKKK